MGPERVKTAGGVVLGQVTAPLIEDVAQHCLPPNRDGAGNLEGRVWEGCPVSVELKTLFGIPPCRGGLFSHRESWYAVQGVRHRFFAGEMEVPSAFGPGID